VRRDDIQFPAKHSALRDDVHVLGALIGDVLKEQGGNTHLTVAKEMIRVNTAVVPLSKLTVTGGNLSNLVVANFMSFTAQTFTHLLVKINGIDQLHFAFTFGALFVGQYPNVCIDASVIEKLVR
jgi:hypothetical protein